MIEVKREEFKEDEVFSRVHKALMESHKVPDYTIKELTEKRHIKDICQEARFFLIMGAKDPFFIHYDVANWIKDNVISIRIDAITFYDNFMEFEKAKNIELHGSKNSDIPNIN